MFVVRFKAMGEATFTDWKPSEEDDYVCSDAAARFRFRALVKAGQRGEKVDGAVPWCVCVVDVSGPDKSGKVTEVERVDQPIAPDKRRKLVQYVDKFRTDAKGPWANIALAS
jgi:hypothetical protein